MKKLSIARVLKEMKVAEFLEKHNLDIEDAQKLYDLFKKGDTQRGYLNVTDPELIQKLRASDPGEIAQDFSDSVMKLHGKGYKVQGFNVGPRKTTQELVSDVQTPEFKQASERSKRQNALRHGPGSESSDPFEQFEKENENVDHHAEMSNWKNQFNKRPSPPRRDALKRQERVPAIDLDWSGKEGMSMAGAIDQNKGSTGTIPLGLANRSRRNRK